MPHHPLVSHVIPTPDSGQPRVDRMATPSWTNLSAVPTVTLGTLTRAGHMRPRPWEGAA